MNQNHWCHPATGRYLQWSDRPKHVPNQFITSCADGFKQISCVNDTNFILHIQVKQQNATSESEK